MQQCCPFKERATEISVRGTPQNHRIFPSDCTASELTVLPAFGLKLQHSPMSEQRIIETTIRLTCLTSYDLCALLEVNHKKHKEKQQ
jgi:hypothetical protein